MVAADGSNHNISTSTSISASISTGTNISVLEAVDKKKFGWFHVKLILITGMGFFTDAYDLFSISLLTPLLGRLYFQDDPLVHGKVNPGRLPIGQEAAVTAVAFFGTLCGQLVFGYLGDAIGRTPIYGHELAIMFIASLSQGMSFGTSPQAVISTLCFWRFILGLGIGGDYPLSSTIMSEYSSTKWRGAYVGAVFAMQGVGILTAAGVTIIIAAIFAYAIPAEDFPWGGPGDLYGENQRQGGFACTWTSVSASPGSEVPLNMVSGGQGASVCTEAQKLAYAMAVRASCPREYDFVWRIVLALGCIPALLTFCFRRGMAETPRYTTFVDGNKAQARQEFAVTVAHLGGTDLAIPELPPQSVGPATSTTYLPSTLPSTLPSPRTYIHSRKMSVREFLHVYGWQLLGCSMCWLLLDIAFYSQNLFQRDIFLETGFLPPAKFMSAIDEVQQVRRDSVLRNYA